MIKWEQRMEIRDLKNQGHGIKAIARMTGRARNTVRKLLKHDSPASLCRKPKVSKLEEFKDYIKTRYEECALSAVRLLAEIKPMGYSGSIQTIRRYLHSLRGRKRSLGKATVRFETPPGDQAQVDWGYCGQFPNQIGQSIRVYVFVMVLSFSRMMYVAFTSSMKLSVLIDSHLAAFDFFGGWTRSILYDNMKQVRLGAQQWNPLFLDFVNHYGIIPKTHKPYWPRTKGKVERCVDYLKDNFLNGRCFVDFYDLNNQGLHWLNTVANVRIHATTRQRPIDLLRFENLIPRVSVPIYQLGLRATRQVDSESFVHFHRSRYSVPPENVGKTVLVSQSGQKIQIRSNDLVIAEHSVADKPGSLVADPCHIAQLWKLTLQRQPCAAPAWNLTLDQSVASHSLKIYEEVEG